MGGGLVFALSRGPHDETVAQSSESRSEDTVNTTHVNPSSTNEAPTRTTKTPQPTTGDISDDKIGKDYPKEETKQWSENSLNDFEKRSRIFHRSKGLEWLKYSNGITPGARITNQNNSGFCSVGYLARKQNRLFVLTAGHCGKKGDVFAYSTSDGELVNFGRMVDSTGRTPSADYGLIEIANSAPMESSIIAFKKVYRLSHWETPENVRENDSVCRMGYRTGLSCGGFLDQLNKNAFEFEGTADHGDSGGPVFLQRGNDLIALGLESYGFEEDATRDGALSISGALDYWDLELLG